MNSEDPLSCRKVLICYNDIDSYINSNDPDYISYAAVLDEVELFYNSLISRGYQKVEKLACKNLQQVVQAIEAWKPEVIVNLCEALLNKTYLEAAIAGIWEILNIPYTGNSFQTLALAQDKILAKKILIASGIPTPAFQVVDSPIKECTLPFPVIIKPSREDGSLGITQDSVAGNQVQFKQIIAKLLEKYRQPLLVEEFILGREFNVGILGNQVPQILAISEISFEKIPEGCFPIASYEAKWLPDHPLYKSTPPICPAQIEESLKIRIERLALAVYKSLNGRDYGRVDIRMDEKGKLYVLEYNPNPDISPDSGFVRALYAAGWDFEKFAEFLIEEALRRNNDKDKIY